MTFDRLCHELITAPTQQVDSTIPFCKCRNRHSRRFFSQGYLSNREFSYTRNPRCFNWKAKSLSSMWIPTALLLFWCLVFIHCLISLFMEYIQCVCGGLDLWVTGTGQPSSTPAPAGHAFLNGAGYSPVLVSSDCQLGLPLPADGQFH